MPWYKVSLPDEEIIADGLRWLIEDFTAIWVANRTPSDAALFASNDIGSRIQHCFFSPGAVRIALPLIKSLGGIECAAPLESAVGLLVGKRDWKEILFSR